MRTGAGYGRGTVGSRGLVARLRDGSVGRERGLLEMPRRTTAPARTTARRTSATSAAPAALAFSAPTVGGGTLDLSTYAGKNVAFWFWAPY